MFDYWIKWFRKPNGEKNPPINRVICHKLCDEWNCKCALSCVLNEKQRLVHPIEIIANVIENSIEMFCFMFCAFDFFECRDEKINRSTLKSIPAIESRSAMMFQFVLNQFWFNAEKNNLLPCIGLFFLFL